MSTTTVQTVAQTALLPRVNLLPPEIEAGRRFKRVQAGLGVGVLAAAGVVGALVLAAGHQVTSAQNDLDAQKAQTTRLNAQVQQYAQVPLVLAQVDAAQAELTQAMGQEIRWSYFLNDLSLVTPNRVWLTSVKVTPATTGSTAPGTTTQGFLQPGVGTLDVEGKGSTHNDVAAWLAALGRQKGLSQPYFTSSVKEQIGTEDSVTFSSQATITQDALSGRYTSKAGS